MMAAMTAVGLQLTQMSRNNPRCRMMNGMQRSQSTFTASAFGFSILL